MKNYLVCSFILLMIGCNNPKDSGQIVLETTGFADSTVFNLMNLETEKLDTGYIINNRLIFDQPLTDPTRFCLYPLAKSRADFESLYFWKENAKISIKATKGNLKNSIVEGSINQLQANILDATKLPLQQRLDSLMKEYRLVPGEEAERKSAIRTSGKEVEKAITNMDVKYIQNNPDELLSAYTLKDLMKYTISKDLTKELYDQLSPANQSSKYGVMVKKFIDLSTDFKIGDKATDFQLKDLNGNSFGLSSFKGKYLLLDFWSSNCGPCLMEIPNLLKSYQENRDKGFEILSVSLDKNRADWEKTVKKYGIVWTTVSDLKGFDGDVPLTYHVYFIPTYYLINREGLIIDKIEGRGQLDEKLAILFEKMKNGL